jgi:hypothetical protein
MRRWFPFVDISTSFANARDASARSYDMPVEATSWSVPSRDSTVGRSMLAVPATYTHVPPPTAVVDQSIASVHITMWPATQLGTSVVDTNSIVRVRVMADTTHGSFNSLSDAPVQSLGAPVQPAM